MVFTFESVVNRRVISLVDLTLILNFRLVLSGFQIFVFEFAFLGVSLLKTSGSW